MPQTTVAPPRSTAKVAMPEGRLATSDPEVARLIDLEVDRERHGLELIASENFVSPAVMEAMGTPLTNKYAEGLPGKRYYGGCEFVDMIEQLAIDRVKKLFNADHANVQAHSGAQANAAVYLAFLKPGDVVLGLDLSQGGHLTHGSPVNFSGLLYHAIHYGVGDDGRAGHRALEWRGSVADGQRSDAIPLLQRALADSERYLGPDHPMTRTVRDNLEAATHG